MIVLLLYYANRLFEQIQLRQNVINRFFFFFPFGCRKRKFSDTSLSCNNAISLTHSFFLQNDGRLFLIGIREKRVRSRMGISSRWRKKNHHVDANDVSRWYIYLRLDKSVACLPSYSSFHTHQTQTQIERKEHAYKPERKAWTWTIKTDTRHDDRVKFKRKWTLRLKEIESVNLFRKIGNESDDSKAQKVFECQLPWSSSSWIDYCYRDQVGYRDQVIQGTTSIFRSVFICNLFNSQFLVQIVSFLFHNGG